MGEVTSDQQSRSDRLLVRDPALAASQWSFVLDDGEGSQIDVPVVVPDVDGGVWADPIDGAAHPAGSLKGEGIIAGVTVRCVSAKF